MTYLYINRTIIHSMSSSSSDITYDTLKPVLDVNLFAYKEIKELTVALGICGSRIMWFFSNARAVATAHANSVWSSYPTELMFIKLKCVDVDNSRKNKLIASGKVYDIDNNRIVILDGYVRRYTKKRTKCFQRLLNPAYHMIVRHSDNPKLFRKWIKVLDWSLKRKNAEFEPFSELRSKVTKKSKQLYMWQFDVAKVYCKLKSKNNAIRVNGFRCALFISGNCIFSAFVIRSNGSIYDCEVSIAANELFELLSSI